MFSHLHNSELIKDLLIFFNFWIFLVVVVNKLLKCCSPYKKKNYGCSKLSILRVQSLSGMSSKLKTPKE